MVRAGDSELDKSAWISLDSPPPVHELAAEGWGVPDTREWDVLMRPWGGNDVYAVGPFDSWDAAETWAENRSIAYDATILGIAERRRPKGMDIAPRRRPRAARGGSRRA